jgi:hypothetical protein
MASSITALTELAEFVHTRWSQPQQSISETAGAGIGNGTLLAQMQQALFLEIPSTAQFKQVISALSAEPDLALFQPFDDKSHRYIAYPGGGARTDLQSVIGWILLSAAQRIFYLRLDESMPSFVRIVLENYEEMLHAGRNEPVRAYSIIGYSGIRLPESRQIQTPWGVLRAAPSGFLLPGRTALVQASAILSTPRLIPVEISSTSPTDATLALEPQWTTYVERTRQLLPLAFALATIGGKRCAPMVMFETTLLPILAHGSFSLPGAYLPPQIAVEPTDSELWAAEEWSRRLDQEHEDNLQVAEKRVVSAIAQRLDRADSLIDAVIAWESLVGTRTETVFRVTAALARLLESDRSKRSGFRRQLASIYDLRSRVVHGDLVDYTDVVSASDEAIDIALKSIKELYSRSSDWRKAKSGERADRIILEE